MRKISLIIMPIAKILMPLIAFLLIINELLATINPNKNIVITPSKTKCKYPITIGLKPYARLLKVGMVDPNCKNNFIESAMPEHTISHWEIDGNDCLNCTGLFFIYFIK